MTKKVSFERTNAWESADQKAVHEFCEDYKTFLYNAKTERVATPEIIKRLSSAGFVDITKKTKLAVGDAVYWNNNDKSVVAARIGSDSTKMQLVGSHIDSPRLDLKPLPLAEKAGIALFKTHYYGGVKKYQWVNTDLALYGVVHTKDGKKHTVCFGEGDDPKFFLSDLAPHLGKQQMEKSGKEVIEGEQLQIYAGTIPSKEKDAKQKVKHAILELLHAKYGITEEDFLYSELTFVPAGKPADIGMDRSLIAAYGHDDKVCAYTSLQALIDAKKISTTAVALFADKEEIGSVGNTGAYSFMLEQFTEMMLEKLGSKTSVMKFLASSNALSADVTCAMDPIFADVHDESNASFIGHGVVLEKYGGSGGKYSTNDASAEFMQYLRELCAKHGVKTQVGELGKIDVGGGGTIAIFLSRYGMNVCDAGPAVLGMHAPREIASKVDVYHAYLLYKAFYLE